MKSRKTLFGTRLTMVIGLSLQIGVMAQEPRPLEAEGKRASGDGEELRQILDELSEEDRQSFRMAVNEVWHAKEVRARRQEMQAANLAYRQALMEEVDQVDVSPRVRAILRKVSQLRFQQDGAKGEAGLRAPESDGGAADRPEPLSEKDRAFLDALRKRAESAPAVIEARRRLDEAVTNRDRLAASANFRQVMRRVMESMDPEVKRILPPRERSAAGRLKDSEPKSSPQSADGTER